MIQIPKWMIQMINNGVVDQIQSSPCFDLTLVQMIIVQMKRKQTQFFSKLCEREWVLL